MARATKAAGKPTKVIGYIRVSTEQQADGGVSLDAQKAKIEAYAACFGLTLADVIVDAGVSAKTLARPGLTRALDLLTSGAADALLVCKLDRLTRSVRDLCNLVERYFGGDGAALLSVAEQIDTRSAGGRMMLNVLTCISQWEREAIGERTADALQHVKAEGVQLGAPALGWTRTEETDADGRRVVCRVEEEAETVERILTRRAAGWTLRDIAAALEAEGVKTKKGGRWHASTIKNVLDRAGTPDRNEENPHEALERTVEPSCIPG